MEELKKAEDERDDLQQIDSFMKEEHVDSADQCSAEIVDDDAQDSDYNEGENETSAKPQ
jgi:hypothetical protein